MRLLVLTTSFPSSVYPSSGVYIQKTLDNLTNNIHATVLTPACDQKDAEYTQTDTIRCIPFRYACFRWQVLAQKPGGIPEALQQGLRAWWLFPPFTLAILISVFFYARHVDLIHAQWSFSGFLAGIVGKLTGTPVVTTLRGSDVRLASGKPVYRKLIQLCGKLSARVVTVGLTMAAQVGQWLPGTCDRIVTIPNGVDFGSNEVSWRYRDRYCITVIGNLIALKQVDVVIRAFASIAVKDDRISMLVIGSGPAMPQLKALEREVGMHDRITFTGRLGPDQAMERLSKSGVFVLASAGEGRPNVVLEAMATGVPIVASDIGGVRELIGNNKRGLLFPVGDAAQLASCIKKVMDDPGLGYRLAGRASLWLKEQDLTWKRTAQRYAELYQQVMEEHHRRGGKRPCAG